MNNGELVSRATVGFLIMKNAEARVILLHVVYFSREKEC